jgi:hypothetical protein
MSVSWLKAQCETQEEILSGCLVFFADSITRCNCVEPCKLTSWDWIPLALSWKPRQCRDILPVDGHSRCEHKAGEILGEALVEMWKDFGRWNLFTAFVVVSTS